MLKRNLLPCLLALFPLFGQAQASNPGLDSRVDSIANQVLQSSGVPSASIAVVQHGRLVLAKAYGSANLDPITPARTDMRYGIG